MESNERGLRKQTELAPAPGITVITITRGRVDLLARAIESVRRQDWEGGALDHLIIVDDCDATASWLGENIQPGSSVTWKLTRRQAHEASGPARLARLRNHACSVAAGNWIAFLDDDNEFELHHIRTLVDCAIATGFPVVHSHRKLFHFDGSPFLENYWPWCRAEREARERYREYVAKGIMVEGSNIVREQTTACKGRHAAPHIDMNVWLLRRDIVLNFPMPEQFTEEDWLANMTEDDKLLERLINAKVPIATTALPSVRYYLGGYSNNFQHKHCHSEEWERPPYRHMPGHTRANVFAKGN